MTPSPLDVQKEEMKFISKERANRKKCPICFSPLKKENSKETFPDELYCSPCNLIFNQTYLNIFWFGFEVGVDAAIVYLIEKEE